MSQHLLEVQLNTGNDSGFLIMGYAELPAPHLFCTLIPHEGSINSPLLMECKYLEQEGDIAADYFDEKLASYGVKVPQKLKAALNEDYAKKRTKVEYVWVDDVTWEQTF